MVKRHMLRIAMPNSWQLSRKTFVFVSRPTPGAHSLESGMPLGVILRDILKLANSSREVKYLLNSKEVLVDGKRRKEHNFSVGVMDVLNIPVLDKAYRILLNENRKLCVVETKNKNHKICKIINKSILKKGKQSISTDDGSNFITSGDYKVGDSVVIEFGKGIKKRHEMTEGVKVMLTAGKHAGITGSLVKIIPSKVEEDKVLVKAKDEEFKTLKKYVFVIGDFEL